MMRPSEIICSKCNQLIQGALEVLENEIECNIYQLVTGVIFEE